jgi:hypothetical protein
MRSPSHRGTFPPCRGGSELPVRWVNCFIRRLACQRPPWDTAPVLTLFTRLLKAKQVCATRSHLTLVLTFACLSATETKMTYDWDGQRTRRMVAFKLMTAVVIGLSVPVAVALWTYVG